MSDHSHPADHAHDHAKHIRTYLIIFGALLVGTVVTVWLNYFHFDSMTLTVSIALFVATIKASLVACYFMHLISEKKAIYAILVATVFFFGFMMFLTIWSRDQMPRGTEYYSTKHVPLPMEGAATTPEKPAAAH